MLYSFGKKYFLYIATAADVGFCIVHFIIYLACYFFISCNTLKIPHLLSVLTLDPCYNLFTQFTVLIN
jgi:hypothetical protein